MSTTITNSEKEFNNKRLSVFIVFLSSQWIFKTCELDLYLAYEPNDKKIDLYSEVNRLE